MSNVWNKGLTKENNLSVQKISQTMKAKKIDNFSAWRKEHGKSKYKKLKKDGNLAELLGVILGDGNIYKFPRTEALRIVGNTKYQGFINRYASIIETVFDKKPHIGKRKGANAANITLYEKNISERLGIPTGSKRDLEVVVPEWILKNKTYIRRYLRGLYESDGCYCVHEKTYTHKFIFSNKNQSLLSAVFYLLQELGFHPHRTIYAIQISRKEEVQKVKDMIQFRKY